MAALLVVLLVLCALGIAVQLGRSFWSRARSVHRHQQALETLADITQSSGGGASPAAGNGSQHQAHVRLLGPSGETSPTALPVLPPPKPLTPTEHASQSPFRRPSRSGWRSGAAAQAALAGPGQLHSRHSMTAAVAPPITPPDGPIGADDIPPEDVTRTIPGLTPPPPKPKDEPTRPVPVIRPHVFYFDDLSARSGQAKGGPGPSPAGAGGAPAGAPGAAGGGPSALLEAGSADRRLVGPGLVGPGEQAEWPSEVAAKRSASRQRRLAAQALVAATVALVVAAGAVYFALGGSGHGPGQASAPSTSLPTSRAAGATTSPTTSPHSTTAPTAPSSSSSTSTTSTTLPKPVQLLSAIGGTDTYQLHSRTASIVVKVTGPCWVEVRAGSPAGQVVTEETLQTGQSATVTGPAWIRLGDPPNASVLVDGTPTTVPGSKFGVPLNLDFTVS